MALLEMLKFLVLVIVHDNMLTIAKKNFLMIFLRKTYGINRSFGSLDKIFSVNFSKPNTRFCLSLH